MRCSEVILGLSLAIGIAGSAAAQCFLCDEVVEFDRQGAECFLSEFDSYRQKLESGEEFIEVDIACSAAAVDNVNTRGGVEVMPRLRERAIRRTVFTFDEAYLLCVRDLLSEVGEDIDPTVEFDLAAQCRN